MAKKIVLINNAVVITDTVSSDILVDIPKRLVYYDLDKLNNNSIIQLRFINYADEFQRNIPAIPLADSHNTGDIPYTQASWRTFARTNLGS